MPLNRKTILWRIVAVGVLLAITGCFSPTEVAPQSPVTVRTSVPNCAERQADPSDPPLYSDAGNIQVEIPTSEFESTIGFSYISKITSYETKADSKTIEEFYKSELTKVGWESTDLIDSGFTTPIPTSLRFRWLGDTNIELCPHPTQSPSIELDFIITSIGTGKMKVQIIRAFQPII